MYTLTPETLIRIEDAIDPKRGHIMKPWGEFHWQMRHDERFNAEVLIRNGFLCHWRCFRLIHTDAITEVE